MLNHKPQLRYDHWLKAGYPIAAGVIEGACRYLVKGRMDLTGARWSVKGAAAVLRIRAVLICGDFEDYFEFFKRCELKRNYHTPHHRKRKKKAA